MAGPLRGEFADCLRQAGQARDFDLITRLVMLADRADLFWFGEPMPRTGPFGNKELNTIGWTVSRYGSLTVRELDALLAAGAPFREDLEVPDTAEYREMRARAAASLDGYVPGSSVDDVDVIGSAR